MAWSSPLYLLDAPIYIFRAYFAYSGRFSDSEQVELNAVEGYLNFLLAWLEQFRPDYAMAAFDESLGSGWRHQVYPPYKTNRALPDAALQFQLECCKNLTRLLGLRILADPVFEADDILASAAKVAQIRGRPVVVISRDKDLAQILKSDQDRCWDGQGERVSARQWAQRYGVSPAQLADFLSLAGDSVDNIPGVVGVGAKTAKLLLCKFNDLEGIFTNLDKVLVMPVRGAAGVQRRLVEGREQAFQFRDLCRLRNDAPVPQGMGDYRCRSVDSAALRQALQDWGFSPRYWRQLSRRYRSLLTRDTERTF